MAHKPTARNRLDGAPSAARARLRYVSDGDPGILRVAAGGSFRYRSPTGRPVRDAATLKRIRALAIPPAWTEVWICPDARGHIQAIGRDARGRKQYRYHARWREVRDRTKFDRMLAFAEALPRIRRALERDLRRPGLPRSKVLAAIVRLLESTAIRVGCDEYARTNSHFGLTTLLDRHVAIQGTKLRFRFKGKSGKEQVVGLRDRRLAHIVRCCQEIPGQRLFQCLDENGHRHTIGSGDVNRYLRQVSGSDFTAKDFRTWAGTVCVAVTLSATDPAGSARAANRAVLAAIDRAAERLGNTRAVCRSSYVHPQVIEAFTEGWIQLPPGVRRTAPRGLDEDEAATYRLLASGRSRLRARVR
jgi:DNA topoisomerase-1